jgi:hypothetical protein
MDLTALKKHNSGATPLTGEKLIVANLTGSSNATINGMDLSALKKFNSGTSKTFNNGDYTD